MTPRYPIKNNISAYKIFIPESNGNGVLGDEISSPVVAFPNESSTPTFISIGSFSTEQEAKNALKYIKSKFARMLLGMLKKTQHNPSAVWAYVPLQDFTDQSDIDWSGTVSEIDKQLYKKYSLSPDEIDFIEANVKSMDDSNQAE